MTAELWVNDNGTPRKIQQVWTNDNGTPRQIQEIWMNDNGTPRLIYQALTIFISSAAYVRQDGGSPCEFYINADGNIYVRTGASLTNIGPWISNAAYVGLVECQATLTSGAITGTFGAYQSTSTTRVWTRGAGLGAFTTGSFLLEFRKAATAEAIGSATITLQCDRT